jgi:mannitol/fructose-specific phosphotransferase system IIA component (Ntr-type)
MLTEESTMKNVSLADYIKEDTVFFLKKDHKQTLLSLLVEKAADMNFVSDERLFKVSIEKREAFKSTGIGEGVAIPHAKLKEIESYFILTAIISEPVEWDALDQKPVSIVFLIGGPEDDQNTYLQILSKLMIVVKNSETRAKLISAQSAAHVIAILEA